MDFPAPNNAPAGQAATDDFWAFNPQQPPPMNAQADDTSLDELLALYQTAQDAPAGAPPFAPMAEPESYGGFDAPAGGEFNFGDPATDQPFPPFGAEGDMGFPAFDAGAPAEGPVFPAFGEVGGAAADAGGFDSAFGSAFASGGDAGGAFSFDTMGDGSSAVPAAGGMPAEQPFGLETAPDAGGFDFGGDLGGPVFDAFPADASAAVPAAPAEEAAFPAFDMPAGADDFSFGAPAAAADELAFGAPAAGGDDFGFGAADPFAAPAADPFAAAVPEAAPAAEPFAVPGAEAFDNGGFSFDTMGDGSSAVPGAEAAPAGDFDFGGDLGGPVFDAFPAAEPAPAAEIAAAPEASEFNFDDLSGPVFEAFPGAGAAEPAAEAAPAESFDFGADLGGPVFDAFPAAEPAAAPAAETSEELQEFNFDDLGDLGGPVFDAFPAAEAAAAAPPVEEAPLEEFNFGNELGGPVFDALPAEPPAPQPEPVAAAPQPPVAPPEPPAVVTPVVTEAPKPAIDPEQTLRLKEVPEIPAPSREAASLPALDTAALAGMTGREVVIKTTDERKMANQQLTQVVGALSTGLDEVQGKMANLYTDLQRAAVSRAPVDEIQRIAAELAQAKSAVGEGSELYKQALYVRQVADAYLQLLKEL